MNLSTLYESIGFDYDESLLGCVMPVYLLYSDIPKYEYIDKEDYFIPIIRKYFHEIGMNNLQTGDLLVFGLSSGHHFCIYAGEDKIFHCTENGKLRLSRLNAYFKYIKYCFRHKGDHTNG